MTAEADVVRIGDLLLKSGLINQADLEEAVNAASEIGLPLGRVIIMGGFLNQEQMQSLINLQSMVRNRFCTTEIAAEAIKLLVKHNLSLETALAQAGWTQRELVPAHKLGELLTEAGIISKKIMEQALRSANETGLPLGRVLVHTTFLKEAMLNSALNAQVLVRDGKLTREQAIQGLKSAHKRQTSLEASLVEQGVYKQPPRKSVKLGELLVLGGIVREVEVTDAIEIGLLENNPLGQVLVGKGLINDEILQVALRLQSLIENSATTPMIAAKILTRVHLDRVPFEEALAEHQQLKQATKSNIRLGEFLKMVGSLTENDIQKALASCLDNPILLGRILLAGGFIDENALHNAIRCQSYMKEGRLHEEQAIIAFNYCQRINVKFDDALNDLGWTIDSPAKTPEPSGQNTAD